MNENQTNSWIFLSAGMADGKEPVTFRSVLGVADGVNHAVPGHKELQTAFGWLTSCGLMRKSGQGFVVTDKGSLLLAEARSNSNNVLQQRKYLEEKLSQY